MIDTTHHGGPTTAGMRDEQFNALAAQSRHWIYSRAYHLLRDDSEAEDVTQEALIKAWTHYSRFDGRNWDGWLRRIVTNAALSRLKTLART